MMGQVSSLQQVELSSASQSKILKSVLASECVKENQLIAGLESEYMTTKGQDLNKNIRAQHNIQKQCHKTEAKTNFNEDILPQEILINVFSAGDDPICHWLEAHQTWLK